MKTAIIIDRCGRISMSIMVMAFAQQVLTLSSQARAGTFDVLPHELHSGWHSNSGSNEVVSYSRVVQVGDANHVRVQFADYDLGRHSYVEVTSLRDGNHQRLDRVSLPGWRNLSAIFNGNQLRLDLHVSPGETNVFFEISGFLTSCGCLAEHESDTVVAAALTSCEGEDDRVASTDNRVGRVGDCTAFLVSNGAIVTAAHCTITSNDVFEVNVPPTSPSGVLQAAAPQDQYPIDFSYRVEGQPHVWGDDWAVMGLLPNPNTGLQAHQVHGFFRVTKMTPSVDDSMRVTGYGLDNQPTASTGACRIDLGGSTSGIYSLCNTNSRTLQTGTGPYQDEVSNSSNSSFYYHRYRVYTHGGNSGSPLTWEAAGRAIGVHTFGCRSDASDYYNLGTSFRRSALADALQGFLGPNIIYLDSTSFDPDEFGTVVEPFRTVVPAVQAAGHGGQLYFVSGSYPASTGGNTGTFGTDGKSTTWTAPVGSVTIGR